MSTFSDQEIKNLSHLLLSVDDSNAEIAFEIIGSNEVGEELVSELFAIYKLSKSRVHQNKAAQLLRQLEDETLNHAMQRKSYLDGHSSRSKIKSYCEGTPLDPMKLALALYNKFGKGLQYLISELDSEDLSSLLKKFMEGPYEFKMQRKGITKIPKELFEFVDLEKINIESNQVKTLPQGITKLKNLKALDLSRNKIKKIPKQIDKLKKLEYLDISRNDLRELPESLVNCTKLKFLDLSHSRFNETFPSFIFDLANLESLNISWITGGRYLDMPEGISKLKKLTYLEVSSSNTTALLQGLPRFTSVTGTAENPIDTHPLALARRAYKQNKEALEYLFAHATSEEIKKILNDLVSEEKLVFDTPIMLGALPKELEGYSIKELRIEGRYSKLDNSFWDSITQLKDLEILVIGDDVRHFDSWENAMPVTLTQLDKLRIFKSHNYGFTKIHPDIGNLKNMEEMIIGLHRVDVELPEEIKQLKKLKKLHVKIIMLAHMEDEQEAKLLSDIGAKYQAWLPNCEVTCTR